MAKDPAFLFYSKDFYEGTRMMLPEERACYVDLLMYQHQNGIIPNDIKRLCMYCSGCSEETILNVLNQKFNQTVDGWLNKRLTEETDRRNIYKPKKIASATLAGLLSKSKLSKEEADIIKKSFKINEFINTEDENEIKKMVREWFNQTVDHMVNYLANANANANKEENKKGVKNEISENAKIVITKLNDLTGCQFQLVPVNARGINARLEDHPVEDLISVVELKCWEWKDNPEMKKHLNPETLFRPTKFPKYLEQVRLAKQNPEKFKNEQRNFQYGKSKRYDAFEAGRGAIEKLNQAFAKRGPS